VGGWEGVEGWVVVGGRVRGWVGRWVWGGQGWAGVSKGEWVGGTTIVLPGTSVILVPFMPDTHI